MAKGYGVNALGMKMLDENASYDARKKGFARLPYEKARYDKECILCLKIFYVVNLLLGDLN